MSIGRYVSVHRAFEHARAAEVRQEIWDTDLSLISCSVFSEILK
jgi:hypothetical protein